MTWWGVVIVALCLCFSIGWVSSWRRHKENQNILDRWIMYSLVGVASVAVAAFFAYVIMAVNM